jgi:hypothetical protein
MTRESIAAHYAISSLFQSYSEETRIYAFTIRQEDRQLFTVGKTRLATGRIKIVFLNSRSSDVLTYAVFHTGDHTINCAVRQDGNPADYAKLVQELRAPFDHGDFPEMIRVMDRHFGPVHYAVGNLFRDEQRRILDQILASPRDEIYNTLRQITDHYAPLRRLMADVHAPPLKALGMATEIVLNTELRRQFESDSMDLERVRALLVECGSTHVTLYNEDLAYALKGYFDRVSDRFVSSFSDLDALQRLLDAAELTHSTPFQINLWKPQNAYFDVMMAALPKMREKAGQGNEQVKTWVEKFVMLGDKLGFSSMARPK